MAPKHLRSENYVEAARHRHGPAELAKQAHEHLLEGCAICAEEWGLLGALRDVFRERLQALLAPREARNPPRDDLSATPEALKEDEEETRRLQKRRRAIYKEKWELLRLPPEQRVAKIHGARTRFHSLLLAEMLIDECRARVRNDPADALSVVDLVPHVLDWTRTRTDVPQGRVLLARAAAHRANALRVAGDLPSAEGEFIRLRRSLAEVPLADARAVAEIASLEASLCIGQRRLDEADEHLDRAGLAARHTGDRRLRAAVCVQRASVMQARNRPAGIEPLLAAAAALLDPDDDSYLFLCTVTGRVNALCELGRPAEARRLLAAHLDHYEASDDPHAGALYRGLEGRCALALGDTAAAEAAFRASRDAHLALGRAYDAALATLDLAESLFQAGKTGELKALAARLVPVFRSRGVSGEVLAALRYLARAVAGEALSTQLFSKLRQRLVAAVDRHP